jgi:hypothetical protein
MNSTLREYEAGHKDCTVLQTGVQTAAIIHALLKIC